MNTKRSKLPKPKVKIAKIVQVAKVADEVKAPASSALKQIGLAVLGTTLGALAVFGGDKALDYRQRRREQQFNDDFEKNYGATKRNGGKLKPEKKKRIKKPAVVIPVVQQTVEPSKWKKGLKTFGKIMAGVAGATAIVAMASQGAKTYRNRKTKDIGSARDEPVLQWVEPAVSEFERIKRIRARENLIHDQRYKGEGIKRKTKKRVSIMKRPDIVIPPLPAPQSSVIPVPPEEHFRKLKKFGKIVGIVVGALAGTSALAGMSYLGYKHHQLNTDREELLDEIRDRLADKQFLDEMPEFLKSPPRKNPPSYKDIIDINARKGGDLNPKHTELYEKMSFDFYEKYELLKDMRITAITIVRRPISKHFRHLINMFTLGRHRKYMKELNLEYLFHTHLRIVLSDGKKRHIIIYEKNHFPEITEDNTVPTDSTETTDIDLNNKKISFGEFVGNGYNVLGLNAFFDYDVVENNCQEFIRAHLKASNIGSEEDFAFLRQDIRKILGTFPLGIAFSRLLSKIPRWWERFRYGTPPA